MKTKPMWGLWLLMIVAPVAVFISVNYWKNLPPPLPPLDQQVADLAADGQPLISPMTIAGALGGKTLVPVFSFCNPTRDKLTGKVFIVNGVSEIAKTPTPAIKNGSLIGERSIGNTAMALFLPEIKAKRRNVIKMTMHWKHGRKSGVKSYTIKPNNSVTETIVSGTQ